MAYLALGNLRARNANTALGLLWWVVNPLLLGGIYVVVFGVIFDVSDRTEDYVAYILSGLFAFYYTRAAMIGGVNSILSNAKLIVNLRFPRLVLPLSALVESAAGFLASLIVFFVIAGPFDGVWPTAATFMLVPVIAIHSVFNIGLAALVARIAVPFRDVNNLVPYLVRIWLYLSPVIYPTEFLGNASPVLRTAFELNPLFSLLSLYRHALLGYPLDAVDIGIAALWAGVIGVLGVVVFVRNESRMVRYL